MIEGSCGAPGKANTSKSQVKGNFGLWRPASWPKAGIDITLGDMRTGFSVVPTCAMPLKDWSDSTDRSGLRAEARLLELPQGLWDAAGADQIL